MANTTKKPAQVLAHQDGRDGKSNCETDFSRIDFITATGRNQGIVWPLLGVGSANAIPRSVLADALGLSDRKLRVLVNRERRAGLPIISASDVAGYFQPETIADLERCENAMRRRARELTAVADSFQRTRDNVLGQERIVGVFNGD